jgi:heme-degrading monooxygenase HmoA
MILIVQHQVRDYDAWKLVFDGNQALRTRHGATGHELYRSLGDPNELTLVTHFPSREQAEAFASDPALKEAMDLAGVIGKPRFTWAEETEALDYTAKAA